MWAARLCRAVVHRRRSAATPCVFNSLHATSCVAALYTAVFAVIRFQPFKLRVLERPMHSDAVRAELEAELAAELAARPQARPAPPPPTAEVRMYAVGVTREPHSGPSSQSSVFSYMDSQAGQQLTTGGAA